MQRKHRGALFSVGAGLLALSLQGYAYHRWTHPDLTEARIIDELGSDELVLRFSTEPEEWAAEMPCESKPGRSSVDADRDAARAAGWIEPICPNDPARMRLTEEGRVRSTRWNTVPHLPADHVLRGWWATVARYERTGPPRIGPREQEEEDLPRPIPAHRVVIPGRWVPNADGERLYATGWTRIRVVDREERYTFWEGMWARHHAGH